MPYLFSKVNIVCIFIIIYDNFLYKWKHDSLSSLVCVILANLSFLAHVFHVYNSHSLTTSALIAFCLRKYFSCFTFCVVSAVLSHETWSISLSLNELFRNIRSMLIAKGVLKDGLGWKTSQKWNQILTRTGRLVTSSFTVLWQKR